MFMIMLAGHQWQVQGWVLLMVVCVGWLLVDAWWDRRARRRSSQPRRQGRHS